jgi:hypothetical protein
VQDQNLQHPDPQELNSRCDEDLLEGIGRLNTMVSGLQRRLLAFVSEYDRRRLWERDGCRHMGQWLAGHLGVTVSEGLRWTTAANALEELPLISAAFGRGVLSFDKVLQLARFATPDTERALIKWARRASVNAIRRKADLANRPSLEETRTVTEERFLEWSWYDDGTRLGIEGMLPADGGAALVTAIEGIAAKLPRVPETTFEQRCADALVALASAGGGRNEPRATVVLSADLGALGSDRAGCEIEGGPVLHPEVARRISCDCRLQAILRDPKGRAVGIGRRSRNVPGWLLRELLARDGGCSFPGCGTRRFLAAHHLIHWAHGGRTELDNLVLLCSFHHKLVHEGGWKVKLVGGLEAMWLRPNGVRYEPGIRLESDAAASLERLDTS